MLKEHVARDGGGSYGERVIDGSDDFGAPSYDQRRISPEATSAQTALEEILADPIAAADEHGYTMPAIAEHLGLHAFTVRCRLTRHCAQIKT